MNNYPETIQIIKRIKEYDELEGKDTSYLEDIIKIYNLYENKYKNEQKNNKQIVIKEEATLFNLYETTIYEEEKKILDSKEIIAFERSFSIANELFITTSLYDKALDEDKEELSKQIIDILEKDPYSFEVLRDAQGIEKDEKKKEQLNKAINIIKTHKEQLESRKIK